MTNNKADAIVQAILLDLGDRRGIGDAFDEVDEDTYKEMRAELVEKVATLL
jgi:hypothetical protein